MSRLSLFNSPFLLGFDQFERTLDRIAKASSDGFPPSSSFGWAPTGSALSDCFNRLPTASSSCPRKT